MSICQDRVVLITGSGGGLGRAYALELAKAGAKVVVNDINLAAAEAVVADITAAGGVAMANNTDITNYAACGEAIKQIVAAFGDLHAVINNAGICRDRMFASLTEGDWDTVIAVHLKGHFCMTHNAVQYWRDQSKAGNTVDARIINTSSGAGLNGSIGQSNYSAAKGGIASLTLVQAAELGRYGITSNALAPAARTGMTAGVFDEMMKAPEDGGFDHYAPENVAQTVVWLASSASAKVTGQVFELEGGKISIADGWKSTKGYNKGSRLDPAELSDVVATLLADGVPAQKVYGAS